VARLVCRVDRCTDGGRLDDHRLLVLVGVDHVTGLDREVQDLGELGVFGI
jgi:hypothetical protein